jgi:hypothetical protein
MPTSAETNGTPSDKPGKSRLEREIEEILAKAEREHPLPPPTPIDSRRRQRAAEESRPSLDFSKMADSLGRWTATAPLVVAFAAAFIALLLRNVSPFLATLAATGAVVALFWPVVTSMRGSRAPEKTWRGQTYTTREEPPEIVTRVRSWLRDRRPPG